jgi:hypothetical protein
MKSFVAWAGLLLASGAGLVFAACSGGDGGNAGAGDAGGDVAVVEDTGDGVKDAGPDIEQDPNVYPAKHAPIPQVKNFGGPVLDHMKVVTVTFKDEIDAGAPADGGADAADDGGGATFNKDPLRDTLRQFDDFIVTSDWWHQAVGAYGVKDGTGKLYAELNGILSPSSLSDDDIQTMLRSAITAGTLPPPEPQIVYALFFPTRTQISAGSLNSCVDFGAYHAATEVAYNGAKVDVAYAVMPRCPSDSPLHTLQYLTVSASHELAEAASDPGLGGATTYRIEDNNDAWIPPIIANAGGEIGDLCIFAPNYDESGFAVQPEWSNAAAADSNDPCQPLDDSKKIYFNAAVRTDLQTVNSHKSYGYIIAKKGTSVDSVIDVFSRAKLPHDLRLSVGKPKFDAFGTTGPIDPTDMNPVGPNVKAELDRQTAHNGNGVILTLTVPNSTPSGNYPFVVRSVLESNDYHDWPVILHVP